MEGQAWSYREEEVSPGWWTFWPADGATGRHFVKIDGAPGNLRMTGAPSEIQNLAMAALMDRSGRRWWWVKVRVPNVLPIRLKDGEPEWTIILSPPEQENGGPESPEPPAGGGRDGRKEQRREGQDGD